MKYDIFYQMDLNLEVRNGYKYENGHTYIYLAFAESPFKNARAR